jgi:pyrroline-5-carboxylate reductase
LKRFWVVAFCPRAAEKGIRITRKLAMIGFIGAGQMAQALAKGLVHSDLFAAENILASDPDQAARNAFLNLLPAAEVDANNLHLAAQCKTIVLAVKPQQMEDVLLPLDSILDSSHLVISIAAGIRLTWLAKRISNETRLVRVMPNTPCLVGQGASGYELGRGATDEDAVFVDRLLCSVGTAFRVDEQQLDAVTALSGSGPAFYCAILEALAAGGEQCGLSHELAAVLALQTMQGTATYLQQTGVTPTELKKRVSSPGGTTVAGLAALDAGQLQRVLETTVQTAARRSAELGGD